MNVLRKIRKKFRECVILFLFRNYKISNYIYNTGYSEVNVKYHMIIPIDKLKSRIHSGNRLTIKAIVNTPHYNEIASLSENGNSSQVYFTYCKVHFPDINAEKNKYKNLKLINDFQMGANFILLVTPNLSLVNLLFRKEEYFIVDGTHRAAVLNYFDAKLVECAIIP